MEKPDEKSSARPAEVIGIREWFYSQRTLERHRLTPESRDAIAVAADKPDAECFFLQGQFFNQ